MGFHCGIGIEHPLLSRLFLTAELEFKYAQIKNFRAAGKYWYLSIRDYEVLQYDYEESTGWLYYCTEFDSALGVRYVNLYVWEVPPQGSWTWIGDIRRAKLDLTGISLRIGIKIRLF